MHAHRFMNKTAGSILFLMLLRPLFAFAEGPDYLLDLGLIQEAGAIQKSGELVGRVKFGQGTSNTPSHKYNGLGLGIKPTPWLELRLGLENRPDVAQTRLITQAFWNSEVSAFRFIKNGKIGPERKIIIDYQASKALNLGLVNASFGLGPRIQYAANENVTVWGGVFKDKAGNSSIAMVLDIKF